MRCIIQHSLPNRVRVKLPCVLTEHRAIALEETFSAVPGVTKATAYPAIASFAVEFDDRQIDYEQIISLLAQTTVEQLDAWEPAESAMLAPRPRMLYSQLANATVWFFLRLLLLPKPIRMLSWLWAAIPFWKAALESLRERRLDVSVLDASAIAIGFTQGANNAGETMFLLQSSEILEDYTQKRAESCLAESLMGIPETAYLLLDGEEKVVPVSELATDDKVIVRMGWSIPVDGEVVDGEAMVNQSMLTGEPLPVQRVTGDSVFAGTTVEEGWLVIRVSSDPENSRVHSILELIGGAEKTKSTEQKMAEELADKLVPWNFAIAGLVALTTRSLTKTASMLMVDYSCALKMSGAIAVMSAQREGAKHGLIVKGSKNFQDMLEADTLVFDKTGTLTEATPTLVHIDPCGGYSRDEVLRLAACLEEHFPHPVANAVVQAAAEENICHPEHHAEVEYIVAHGIASSLGGKRVVIGSQHFVVEDEGVKIDDEHFARINENALGTSPLFLAVDGVLEGILYIDDPLREEVPDVIEKLRKEGFKRIIMLTGDADRVAKRMVAQAGIDEYCADMLPESKFEMVRKLQSEGCKVCMVGDGINDSPALAAADVSIAMSSGSAVAREAADIVLVSNDLENIVMLRRLSKALDRRMRRGYGFTIGFNSLLMALGLGGLLTPQQSALLHNGSTLALTASNARQYFPEKREEG